MNTENKKNELVVVTAKLKTDEAEAFRALAERRGMSAERMLSACVRDEVEQNAVREKHPTGNNAAVLTYKNVDRLKHEVAFYNPNHFNPNEMMNYILNEYFKMVEKVRRTN